MSDLTVAAAAREFNCSPKTVYEMLRVGTLRGYKIGRQWRIRPSAIASVKTPVDPPARPADVRSRVVARRPSDLPGWHKFSSR